MKLRHLPELALLVVCAGCSSSPWAKYPGAGKPGHCAEYAICCATDLTLRGGEAYVAEYTWRRLGKTGRHAVVLFQQHNEWFVVGNEAPWPLRVNGKSPASKVMSAFDHITSVDRVYSVDAHGFTIKQLEL